tara:strand:- start:959 stop:1195 length:237 start_codon:yes stop_codon:yes gene_type:complete
MLKYENIKVIRTDIKNGTYDNKKNKYVDFKKPKITTKILELNDSCYDLGELYSMLKHHAEQNVYCDELKVEFKINIEF